MSKEVRVREIYISSEAGAPMQRVTEVHAIEGVGLEGDRYAKGQGFWQTVPRPREGAIRQVSIITQKAVEEAAARGANFSNGEHRRNIVLEGDIDLASLDQAVFQLGDALLRGAEDCDPCKRPSQVSGVPGFEKEFRGDYKGGLRAEIISSGTIFEGSQLLINGSDSK